MSVEYVLRKDNNTFNFTPTYFDGNSSASMLKI